MVLINFLKRTLVGKAHGLHTDLIVDPELTVREPSGVHRYIVEGQIIILVSTFIQFSRRRRRCLSLRWITGVSPADKSILVAIQLQILFLIKVVEIMNSFFFSGNMSLAHSINSWYRRPSLAASRPVILSLLFLLLSCNHHRVSTYLNSVWR